MIYACFPIDFLFKSIDLCRLNILNVRVNSFFLSMQIFFTASAMPRLLFFNIRVPYFLVDDKYLRICHTVESILISFLSVVIQPLSGAFATFSAVVVCRQEKCPHNLR